jgi:hypothetical protein
MPQGELTYGCVHVEELAVTSQSRRGPPGAGGWLWLTRPLRPAARCPRPRAQLAHTTACAAQARGLVAGTKLGMLMLRSYLLISVLLLVVKAVQLRGG